MFNQLARFGMAVVAVVVASTAFGLAETTATPGTTTVAQTSPAPSPTPNPFQYRGFVRAYNFTRQNASNLPGGMGPLNQSSFNVGVSLHGDYNLGNGFKVNASYFYSNPLTGYCANNSDYVVGSTCRVTSHKLGSPDQHLAPDVTLPPYIMSTLYEANLNYKGNGWNVTAGDQVINTPWANASDSRLKPNAFQGIDASYAINKQFTIEGMYMNRWESRISPGFDNSTLITSFPLDDGNGPGTIYHPGGTEFTNNGFFMGKLGYVSMDKAFTANGYFYSFDQISNLFWADAKYTWSKQMLKPFIAAQFGSQQNQGSAQAGKINSTVIGLQGGVTLTPNVTFTLGYNNIPTKYDTINVTGSGITCSSKDKLSIPAGTSLNYFVPQSGTPQCTNAGVGLVNVYYGGFASPYTDSYATDPLFTTSISQGMADRRATGSAIKAALGFVSNDKRFVASISRAYYVYGNPTVGLSPTQETNLDGQYYFSPLPKSGPYHGFMLRHRYAERTQQFTEFYGGTPLFKYNRTQLEFDF